MINEYKKGKVLFRKTKTANERMISEYFHHDMSVDDLKYI
jgi:hypothetical protein